MTQRYSYFNTIDEMEKLRLKCCCRLLFGRRDAVHLKMVSKVTELTVSHITYNFQMCNSRPLSLST